MKTFKLLALAAAVCAWVWPCLARGQQNANLTAENSGTATVAYVYVSNPSTNGGPNQIQAYAANSQGQLTPVAGSPFAADETYMVVNGSYLMGINRTQTDIDSYRIESDGALTFATSTNYTQQGCGVAGSLYFDHTGSDLYVQEGLIDCANSGVASFSVDKSSGGLQLLGTANTGAFPGDFTPAFFIGNNVYAYTADNSACMYYDIYGFKRQSNGLLVTQIPSYNLPTPPASFTRYVPFLSAADRTRDVAFFMIPATPPGCSPNSLQLASYTVDGSGNLNTTNTSATMPTTRIANPYDLKMAPSGKLLAAAGQEGLQVFHFNGSSPITRYTGLLTTDPITQMFWDNNNHLYAISQSSNKLYVFGITPTGYRQAPGSPYQISSPQDIIVQPLQ
ncbi:MAG TPA: hypothetical protein VFB28_10860 [Terriglobales bacterium]|nr:hypothetical protein [Terriglobales bacterium]